MNKKNCFDYRGLIVSFLLTFRSRKFIAYVSEHGHGETQSIFVISDVW